METKVNATVRKSASLSVPVVGPTDDEVQSASVQNKRHLLPPGGLEAVEREKGNVQIVDQAGRKSVFELLRANKYVVAVVLVVALSLAVAVPLAVVLSGTSSAVGAPEPEIEPEEQALAQLQAEFSYLEDCKSYDLEFCSAATSEVQPFENARMRLRNNIWWFEDSVQVQAKQKREGDEIYWYVRTTISFGHDPLYKQRSKVFLAKLLQDYTVLTWKTYELVEGSHVYRCSDKNASEWQGYETKLVESMLSKSPMLLLHTPDDEGEEEDLEDENVERNGTFGMLFNLSEFDDVLDDSVVQLLGNSSDSIFAEIPDTVGPTYLYEDIVINDNNGTAMEWEDDDFFDVDCENWFDLPWNGTLDLSEQIPGRTALQTEVGIETEPGPERRLDFVPSGSDNWQSWQNIPTPIPFIAINPSDVLPYMGTEESLTQEFFEKYFTVLMEGDGLPSTKALIEELQELRKWIQKYLDLFESTDYNFAKILKLLVTIQTTNGLLQTVDGNLSNFILFLKALKQIPQVAPYVRPVLFHLERVHQIVVRPAADRVRSVQDFISRGNYKSFAKATLVDNEKLAEVFMVTGLLDNNLIIPPLELMKNCKNVDRLAGSILNSNTIQSANNVLKLPWESLERLNVSLPSIKVFQDLDDLLKEFLDALEVIMDFMKVLKPVLDPFEKVLTRKISLPVFGPFCMKTIPKVCLSLPCGTRFCRRRFWCGVRCRCSWRGCRCRSRYCSRRFPCGIRRCKRCTPSTRVVIYCYKKFSYSVAQLLKGVNGIIGLVLGPMKKEMNRILNSIPLPSIGVLPEIPVDIARPLATFPRLLGNFKPFAAALFDLNVLQSFNVIGCSLSDKSPAPIRQLVSYMNGTILKSVVAELLSCPFWDALNVVCEDGVDAIFCNKASCEPEGLLSTAPSGAPTLQTLAPVTEIPSSSPVVELTSYPSTSPTTSPTTIPTNIPTSSPSAVPTSTPTAFPTSSPTRTPTKSPSNTPTTSPSGVPTSTPTSTPTTTPTTAPSKSPTSTPTSAPSGAPSVYPTAAPSSAPTSTPTSYPTSTPTPAPTYSPSVAPTSVPTNSPTGSPSVLPTSTPTTTPTSSPSRSPTGSPTKGKYNECFPPSLSINTSTTMDDLVQIRCPGCAATHAVSEYDIVGINETDGPSFIVTVPSSMVVNCLVTADNRFALISYGNGHYFFVRAVEVNMPLTSSTTASIRLKLEEETEFPLELAAPTIIAFAPKFSAVTITPTGSLSAAPFNGNAGGALVLQAQDIYINPSGTLTMSQSGGRPPLDTDLCPDSYTGRRECNLGADGPPGTSCILAVAAGNGAVGLSPNRPGSGGTGGPSDPASSTIYEMQSTNGAAGGTPHFVAPLDRAEGRGKLFLGEGGANGAGGKLKVSVFQSHMLYGVLSLLVLLVPLYCSSFCIFVSF